MPRSLKAIRAFWSWFAENEDELAEHIEDDSDDFASDFSARIREATQLDWEAGGELELSLCPVTRAQLEEAERFVCAAPALKRWRLAAARPPKKEVSSLSLNDVRFDLRSWTYRLFALNERRQFEVAIWPEGANGPREDIRHAAWLAVALKLGDRAFVELIDRVTILVERPSERTVPFEHLRDHLGSVAHPDIVALLRDP